LDHGVYTAPRLPIAATLTDVFSLTEWIIEQELELELKLELELEPELELELELELESRARV
jgi:hypothetical protein